MDSCLLCPDILSSKIVIALTLHRFFAKTPLTLAAIQIILRS